MFAPLEDSEKLAKLRVAWHALENGKDATIEGTRVVIRGGKFVIREAKFVAGATAGYTVFCLVTQDKTLGDCLKEGVVFGIGTDIAKIMVQKYAIPKIKTYFSSKIQKQAFSVGTQDLRNVLSDYTDEVVDGDEVKGVFKKNGWQYDENLKQYRITREFGKDAEENVINPLEEFTREKGYPPKSDDFTFVYEYDNQNNIKGLKEVIYDPKGFKEKLSDRILYPLKEKIGKLEEKTMSNRVLDSGSLRELSEHSKDWFEKNPGKAKEFLEMAGVKVGSEDEAVRILSMKFGKLAKNAEDDLAFLVVEKGSDMDNLIGKIDGIYTTPGANAFTESRSAVRGYLYDTIESNNKDEAKRILDLLNGKRLRLKEDVEIFSRGTFGYMILRFQDLYTPLGATYWDKYFSYYGYTPIKKLPYGWCQTQCEDGMICVQLGACVRQYELPESCVNAGVSSIKLRRDSVVAKDPRFYLVSPCESKVKMKLEGDTIFIEPYISASSDKKSYCYATAGLVNWYIGAEAAAYVTRCVSASLCAVGTAGAGVADAIKACAGFGQGFTGPCSIVSNLAGLVVDLYRETQLIFPDVYKNRPDLIDFRLGG